MNVAGYEFERKFPRAYTWIGEETIIDIIDNLNGTYLVRIQASQRFDEPEISYVVAHSKEELEELIEDAAF